MADETIFSNYSMLCEFDSAAAEDVWELSTLNLGLDIGEHQRKTVSFKRFNDELDKQLVKCFAYFRLAEGMATSHVASEVGALAYVEERLAELYGRRLEGLDRDAVIEIYREKAAAGASVSTANSLLTAMRNLVSLSCLLKLPYGPTCLKSFPKDLYGRKRNVEPDPYREEVVAALMGHRGEMEEPYRGMLELMASIPIRYSEVQGMRTSQILRRPDGTHSLTIKMYKVKRYKTVPVPREIGYSPWKRARERMAESAEDDPLMFVNARGNSIDSAAFNKKLQALIDEIRLCDDDGGPIRASTRRLRAYAASKLISQGLDPAIVGMLLGHSSAYSLKHYARVFPQRAHEIILPVLEDREWHIENMGRIRAQRKLDAEDGHLLRLSNGFCSKPIEKGICRHANACYSCALFMPKKECLDMYVEALNEARDEYESALESGLGRMADYNKDLMLSLKMVIDKTLAME